MFKRTVFALIFLAGAARPQATFKTGARLVQMDVTVTNDKGVVRGLTKDDFIVEDKGKKQDIAVFVTTDTSQRPAPEQLPAGISTNYLNSKGEQYDTATAILYDRINTAASDQAFTRQQVLGYLAGLRDTDRVGFYSLGFQLTMVQDYQEEAGPLIKVAKMLQAGTSAEGLPPAEQALHKALNEALTPMQQLANQARVNITYPAFRNLARHLSGASGRKNLIWVASVFPITYGNSQERRRNDEQEVNAFKAVLTEGNITLYPIDPGGTGASFNQSEAAPSVNEGQLMPGRSGLPPSTSATSLTGNQTFQLLASATGGKAYRNSNDIAQALREVIESGAYTYTLGFYPGEKTLDGKEHKLEVKLVKKPATDKAKVSFRKEYLAWGPNSPPEIQMRPNLGEVIADVLPATGIGMIAVANPDPNKPGFHILDVRITVRDLKLEQLAENWVGQFDMAIGIQGAQGGSVKTFPMKLTNDQYQQLLKDGLFVRENLQTDGKSGVFNVVVQDKASGAVGSIRVPFK
jgi:VWFA-related protein